MPDFNDHKIVLEILVESQDADGDNRDNAREAHLFLDKRDGQWEPYWWNASRGRPRYTFDMTSPIVDQIAGKIEQSDFNIKIRPAGGDVTKDDAKLLDGLIRNIENLSNANDIYNLAARSMVTAGIDGWQVKQKFADDDSFDQDLVIEPIANFVDSVWFGPFKLPDASDAKWAVVLEALERREYEERFPDGGGMSIGENRLSQAYFDKHDQIIIGQIYFIEERPRQLLKMASGTILEDNEENRSILDELAAAEDTVVDQRTRKKRIVKSRLFDGGGWLNEAEETVFDEIPIIPTMGNFKIFENKLIYRGIVEKLFDTQRVMNYAKSREIEEGALAPRTKYWMTETQVAGHEREIATLNTNPDPVQLFNPDAESPGPPQQSGGAVVNPGLRTIGEDMRSIIAQNAGLFAASMGDNPNVQSGVAIERLQGKGDVGTTKYFRSQERAVCRTARILIGAIPKVYSTQRQTRILKEDGSFDIATINQPIFDEQTQRVVVLNDLSKGRYDVSCTTGPSFSNRQQETVSAITEMAQFDPSIVQGAGDVLFNNLSAPGMDLIAERKRAQLFQAGAIPFEQMTDEEKQQTQEAEEQAAQNPPEPDPATLLAQAEINKAEAQANKVNIDAQISQRKEDREDSRLQTDVANDQVKATQQQQEFDFKQLLAVQEQQLAQQKQLIESVSAQANILKTLRDAMGVDTFVGPNVNEAFIKQAQNVNQAVGGDPIPRGSLTR